MRPTDPRLWGHLRPARGALAVVVTGGVAASLLVIGQAWLVAGLVVAVTGHHPVAPWAWAVVAVFVARGLVGLTADVAAARAAGTVATAVRRDLVHAVLGGSRETTSTGETAALLTRGVAAAEPYLTRYLPALVLAAVLPCLTVVAIATQDLTSAVIVVGTLPLVPVFGALVGLATRDRARRQWRVMACLSGHFLDVMRGLPTLVAFRRAEAQTGRIQEITERYRRASLGTLRIAFASSAVLELVATLSVALVAVTVGVRLDGGGMDLRTALVVLLLAPEAYWPLRKVGAEFHAAAEGVATFERVHELLTACDRSDACHADAGAHGDVVVDDVTLSYPGRLLPALDHVSVWVPRRGITALTGPSGSGKSTLLAVLAGLRAPDSGCVRVRGEQVGGEAWRRRVALMPQRPLFMRGSIADNVRLAAPGATDQDVWDALGRVALRDRVRQLPDGLDTPLGEDGGTLSAGERARLALARVVLSDRPVVLLDEPTAHLDPLTEEVVSDLLVELARDRAVVVVAHRPALVGLADHVIDLPSGPEPRTAPGPRDARSAAYATPTQTSKPEPEHRGPSLLLASLVGGLASVSGVALTATSGWLIVQAASRPPVLTLLVAIVAVRTFGLARPGLRYLERLWSHDAALRMLARRRAQVYDALVPLTPARLGPRRGDVLASVVDDVDSVLDRELRSRLPVRGLVLVGVVAATVTTAIDPGAGLVVAALCLAGGLARLVTRAAAGRAEAEAVDARAELSEQVVETIQVADELAVWQAEDRAVATVSDASNRLAAGSVRSAAWLGATRAGLLVASGAAVAVTGWWAAADVAGGRLSAPLAGLLVLVPLALAEVVVPLAEAGAAAARARAAESRLGALLSLPPAVSGPERPVPAPAGSGIEVDTVVAGWGGPPAVDGLSLAIAPRSRIGVVGPSGSGKSTLAALLLRFLEPTSGAVRLGGVPLTDLDPHDVRRAVGLVDDDPHVFASTVAENIRLARPSASDVEVEAALSAAGLADWLDGLADGLATRLGDGAAAVSGGERARLAVARSLLADHRVLVLDEPTAHLDHATAEALARQVLGADTRTVVWITHEQVGTDLLDHVVSLGESPDQEAHGGGGASARNVA